MAQAEKFIPLGSLQVKKGDSYTTANLPSSTTTINAVRIVEANRIWSPDIKQDGTQTQKDGKPYFIKRAERGARIKITNSGVTYNGGQHPIPTLYKEGEEIVLDDNNTYQFYDDCVVEYGNRA